MRAATGSPAPGVFALAEPGAQHPTYTSQLRTHSRHSSDGDERAVAALRPTRHEERCGAGHTRDGSGPAVVHLRELPRSEHMAKEQRYPSVKPCPVTRSVSGPGSSASG